jgi:hypothetical protein
MTDRAVLALAGLLQAREGARRGVDRCQRVLVGGVERTGYVAESQLREVGDAEKLARRAGAERVGALVAPRRRVGLLSDAEAVEHDDEAQTEAVEQLSDEERRAQELEAQGADAAAEVEVEEPLDDEEELEAEADAAEENDEE